MSFDIYELAAWILSACAAVGAVIYRVAVKKRRTRAQASPDTPITNRLDAEAGATDAKIDAMDARANPEIDDSERVSGSDPAAVAKLRDWAND